MKSSMSERPKAHWGVVAASIALLTGLAMVYAAHSVSSADHAAETKGLEAPGEPTGAGGAYERETDDMPELHAPPWFPTTGDSSAG